MMSQEQFIHHFQLWKHMPANKAAYLCCTTTFNKKFKKIHDIVDNITDSHDPYITNFKYTLNSLINYIDDIRMFLPVKIRAYYRMDFDPESPYHYQISIDDRFRFMKSDIDYGSVQYSCEVLPYFTNSIINGSMIVSFPITDGICDILSRQESSCLDNVNKHNDKYEKEREDCLAALNNMLSILRRIQHDIT